jgi:HK97 gp10 family phage protein
MAVTVKVEGLRELGESMRGLSEAVNKKIARAATAAAAGVIKKAAQERVPVDTGALKKGIVVKRIPPAETGRTSTHMVTVSSREMRKYVAKSRAAIVELQGPIAPRMVNGKLVRAKKLQGRKDSYESFGKFFYAHFIEFGTVRMTAKPFMRPAFDMNKERAVEVMKTTLARGIERALKSK